MLNLFITLIFSASIIQYYHQENNDTSKKKKRRKVLKFSVPYCCIF